MPLNKKKANTGEKMKNEYDFSQGIKNPYARNLKDKKVEQNRKPKIAW